jgi:hypothetical protein
MNFGKYVEYKRKTNTSDVIYLQHLDVTAEKRYRFPGESIGAGSKGESV